jgi:hypothetical protein
VPDWRAARKRIGRRSAIGGPRQFTANRPCCGDVTGVPPPGAARRGGAGHVEAWLGRSAQLAHDDAERPRPTSPIARSGSGRVTPKRAWTTRQALARSGPGQHVGQARAVNQIGWCHAQLGDHRQALTACQRALTLHQQVDNREGQAPPGTASATPTSRRHPEAAGTAWCHALTILTDLNQPDTAFVHPDSRNLRRHEGKLHL